MRDQTINTYYYDLNNHLLNTSASKFNYYQQYSVGQMGIHQDAARRWQHYVDNDSEIDQLSVDLEWNRVVIARDPLKIC